MTGLLSEDTSAWSIALGHPLLTSSFSFQGPSGTGAQMELAIPQISRQKAVLGLLYSWVPKITPESSIRHCPITCPPTWLKAQPSSRD